MWKEAKKFLLNDKYIGPLIKKYGDCSLKAGKKANYFIDLVEAICSQQLSGKAAATIFGRVRVGLSTQNCTSRRVRIEPKSREGKLGGGGGVTPENILATRDLKFRSWGLSRQKIKYLRDLAEKVKKGELKIKSLNELSDEEVARELISVKGIGPWTAEMFLMFSLGRPDIFPVDDLGIKNGVEKLTKTKRNAQSLAKFGERWKPYRTVASWYIWKSLDNR